MQAMATDTPVMVTMDGGKGLYRIGFAVRLQSSAKWLSFNSDAISGYRDEKSKQVVLETDYLPLHEKAAKIVRNQTEIIPN